MSIYWKALLMFGLLPPVQLSIAHADKQSSSSNTPEIVAVKFHADWCGSCRRMGTAFEDLSVVSENKPVLFTTLDLTDNRTRKQAAYLMSMLRFQEAWKECGAGQKTGFVLLIDPATQQPIGRLTADQDLKQMKAAFQEAVAKTSA
ncbi:MAG: thioredoxin domain-containing protein [Pirellulales bacterium]